MKKIITCLAAAFIVIGAQSLMAQTTNSPATSEHHGATPEQRKERMQKLMKALDLTKADLKGLSKEDRQAKMKSQAETVVADLKAKQTAGTLTEEGQKRLDLVEKFLAHQGHPKASQ